jgi:hypothetical protein
MIELPCWFLWPVGDAMDRLNAFVFFKLGSTLRDCVENRKMPLFAWAVAAEVAQKTLAQLIYEAKGFKLEESRAAAGPLDLLLRRIHLDFVGGKGATLGDADADDLADRFHKFEHALSLELGRAPIFFVTQKGIYDTDRLINNADAVYQGYEDRLPQEARDDTREAGKCLAFSLYTAAGFHVARATEAVIRSYMDAYGCPPIRESQRNWGNYTRALEEKNANKIIIHHIDQLRQLHRNPITHPEVTLTQAEALALQAMCQSVIQAMVGDMESRKQEPNPTIVAMLPAEYAVPAMVAAMMPKRLGWMTKDDAPLPPAEGEKKP